MTLCSILKPQPCPVRVKFLLRSFPDPLGLLRVFRLLRRSVFNCVAFHSTTWSFDAVLLFDPGFELCLCTGKNRLCIGHWLQQPRKSLLCHFHGTFLTRPNILVLLSRIVLAHPPTHCFWHIRSIFVFWLGRVALTDLMTVAFWSLRLIPSIVLPSLGPLPGCFTHGYLGHLPDLCSQGSVVSAP